MRKDSMAFFILLLIILVVLVIPKGLERDINKSVINKSVTSFITNVAAGDSVGAEKYAIGKVLWDLSNTENIPAANIKKIDTSIKDYSDKWARVYCTVEMVLSDGSSDVCWNEIKLIKQNDWKVFSIKETTPSISAKKSMFNDIEPLETVLKRYFLLMGQGKEKNALHIGTIK